MKLLIMMGFLSFSFVAHAHQCKLERTPLRRVYLHHCPEDTYVTSSSVDHYGNFTYTYLKCEKLEVVCEDEEPLKPYDEE